MPYKLRNRTLADQKLLGYASKAEGHLLLLFKEEKQGQPSLPILDTIWESFCDSHSSIIVSALLLPWMSTEDGGLHEKVLSYVFIIRWVVPPLLLIQVFRALGTHFLPVLSYPGERRVTSEPIDSRRSLCDATLVISMLVNASPLACPESLQLHSPCIAGSWRPRGC